VKSTAIIAGAAFAIGLLAALAWSLPSSPAGVGASIDGAPRTEAVPQANTPRGAQRAATDGSPAAILPAPARPAAPAAATAQPLPQPLPPIGAPLAGVLSELEQRAKAGEAPAACRLAAELSRCGSLERRRMFRGMFDPLANPQRNRDGSGRDGESIPDWQIDAAARLDVGIEVDEQICADISREQTRNSLPWLYEAARLGSLPAMTSFVSAAWWNDGSAVHHPQILDRYRAEATTMAEAAIAAGDRSLLMPLGLALAGSAGMFGLLSEVAAPDPVRARALLLVAASAPGASSARGDGGFRRGNRGVDMVRRTLDQLDAQLAPADVAASEAQAARLRSAINASPQPAPLTPPAGPFSGAGSVRAEDCATGPVNKSTAPG